MSEASIETEPRWFSEFREKFSGGLAHTFILHGAVEDYVGRHRQRLDDYLDSQLGEKRAVVFYNCSRGIQFASAAHRKMVVENGGLTDKDGSPIEIPPKHIPWKIQALEALPFLEQMMLAPRLAGKMAVIIEYPELVWPESDYGHLGERDRITLATLRRWATSSEFVAAGQVIMLLTPTITDLHSSLRASSSMIESVEITLPNASEREQFITTRIEEGQGEVTLAEGISPTVFAGLTGGLSRVLVDDICLRAVMKGQPVDHELIKERKDQIIRNEFGELIEILEPRHGFDAVGGMGEVKEYLRRSVIAPLRGEAPKERMPSGVMLAGPPGTGKGQPLHSRVLTPAGWKQMKDIQVGDEVIDPLDGQRVAVTGVFPQGEQLTYRFHFSDGSSAECDENHLWDLRLRGRDPDYRTYQTRDIVRILEEQPHARFFLPLSAPAHFDARPVDQDPYELGRSRAISQDRGIPAEYLFARLADRQRLLQGLLDAAGDLDPLGRIQMLTSSSSLAEDTIALVRSLGGTARLRDDRLLKQALSEEPSYRLILHLPDTVQPFTSREKNQALLESSRRPVRRLVRVEKLGVQPTQCIKVGSAQGLYVTDDFVVTHNTFLVSALAKEAGVNVVKLNAGKLLGQYVGNSERNLEKALACIRSLAPTLVMIDEIEQQFQRGGKSDGGVERRIFGRLLEEMSGASGTRRGDVVWFAATNRIDMVDPALRRPGRFDRIVPLLPPTREERWEIVNAKMPGAVRTQEEAQAILLKTDSYTGADIDAVVVKAVEIAYDRGAEAPQAQDILQALDLLRPSSSGNEVMQMIAVALEHCNDLSLVPQAWRARAQNAAHPPGNS